MDSSSLSRELGDLDDDDIYEVEQMLELFSKEKHCIFRLVSTLGNMSSIYHSGYGYSKKLCEDVTSWFLNKVLSTS